MPAFPAIRRMMVPAAALVLGAGATAAFTAANPPQPHMRAALASLRAAHHHLDEATPDKGGHRARALELVAQAETEVQAGINYDNTHH